MLGSVLGFAALAVFAAFPADLSDEQIRQILIQQSIQAYPGNCPCPYNLDRAGRHCGKRSAWSRPDGYAPLCYSSDITQKMIEKYRKEHGE
jgi:hypothetical protein